jgi:estrone sulfotransferase
MFKFIIKKAINFLGYDIRRFGTRSTGDGKELFAPNEKDIYLVSYPRSGNTWMRVLISELLYGESGESIKSLDYYVPDIYEETYADNVIPAPFHCVKSHSPCNYHSPSSNYKQVIYLIRDPRDVVLSYYRYQGKLAHYSFGFEQFIIDWLNGRIWPCSWQEHVNSWTGGNIQNKNLNLYVVRYEDLLSDTERQILELTSSLGLNVTKEAVQRAVASANVENMRMKEAQGMRASEKAQGFQFIGLATSKAWKDTLTLHQLDLINSYAGHAMERHGYI